MRSTIDFGSDWLFEGREPVTLPHSAVELPFAYFDETTYQRPFTYEKRFIADPAWAEREVALHFEGAMSDARVSLNGEEIAAHRDGYTPFEARLTSRLVDGENLVVVRIDGSENPEIPPFGGLLDFLTYAGIYRDVWLRISAPVHLANVKIETPDALADKKTVRICAEIANPQNLALTGTLIVRIKDGDTLVQTANVDVSACEAEIEMHGLAGLKLWDVDAPKLYQAEITIETPYGTDCTEHNFGFRTAEFTPEGFRLNGRPLKIRGLNRHQSFPYFGYALGRAAQERDAEILKHELKLNMVRTSHYPQSKWFLDRCDQVGLLVLEEIPGWHHIGDAAWKAEAIEDVRRMVRRDWNHPSIVLWGVRVNESPDDHEFYTETNRVAHELDTTRQTGGIRSHTDSEMLEDVYTMNDFILGMEEMGGNRPRTALRPISETTGLGHPVPYLVTEFNGHMLPSKSYDQEQRLTEQVIRHLTVLNAAYGDPGISGAIGWCAFDYQTHCDFGSGDRICHHGVMDMYREPKFAAYAYKSQCDRDDEVVLKPVTLWSRGERNGGGIVPLIVLTNCDEVELRYGGRPLIRLGPDSQTYPHLPHPPVVFERDHFVANELGILGMRWEDAIFVGYIAGKQVAEARFARNPVATTLEVVPDRDVVSAARRDCVRVVVRALDQVGNKLPYMFESVMISVTGEAECLGPTHVPLRGGATGFWLRATGTPGPINVAVTCAVFGTTTVDLRAA